MKTKKEKIAIVGGGLVGCLLAIYLMKRGYSVSVFEKRMDIRKHVLGMGRSINMALSNRGLRALEEIGLADRMKQVAIPMSGRMMHDVNGNLSHQPYGQDGQYINSISRTGLNMVLMDEAEKNWAQFFFEHRCLSVDAEKNEIEFQHFGGTVHKQFDLIIGTDGAFSAIRGSFQITDRFDYAQHYIEHGYKELRIPSSDLRSHLIEKNALHIWPRETFMMIALPNPDGSFTGTLFLPFEGEVSFNQLQTESEVTSFFEKYFPDALKMMPTLVEDFRDNPTGSMVTIHSYPWVKNKTLLIGDAAHAIVPFFGQGMNSGFEDCRILNQLLDKHQDDWDTVLPIFQELRKPDADAIAQLALDNFVEMRDLVADADFLLRKKIEAKIHSLYPEKWIPLYTMVTFREDIRYSEAYTLGQKQKKIMDEVMKRKDIETNWENLDFEKIVNQLQS
ncbi:MAG TPA: NAD(P)/FAD-dependent oxidoreductase [Chryseolinea sp.]|nr:NAD(P)/FAD-dependent oxidoreductase [Chryseolinea sp.]